MKTFVTVKLRAKEKKVEKIDNNHFLIFIKERPIKGGANKAITKLMAKYFKVPMAQVKIMSGVKSKQKVIRIQE